MPDETGAAPDEEVPTVADLLDQYEDLDRDHQLLADEYAAVLRRLNDTRRERDLLRDQLTTIHPRPRPRVGWLCTCDDNVLEHDADGQCQVPDCLCPQSLTEIRSGAGGGPHG
jgi:hypothetical protein